MMAQQGVLSCQTKVSKLTNRTKLTPGRDADTESQNYDSRLNV